MKRILALTALGVFLTAGPAFADSIFFSNPTVTPNGSEFLWSYTLTIDDQQFIDTAGHNQSFATLYDINGLSSAPTWVPNPAVAPTLSGAATSALVGPTPPTQEPTDNPLIPNVTVTFTGTVNPVNTLGVLSFLDTYSGENTATGQFSAEATDVSDGAAAYNTTSVPVPAPEPGTLALLSSGVLGLVGAAWRRRSTTR